MARLRVTWRLAAILCGIVAPSLSCVPLVCVAQTIRPTILTGGFYDTPEDLARFRAQRKNPELSGIYRTINERAEAAKQEWTKHFPATVTPRSTDSLLAAGRASVRNNGYVPLVLEALLEPTDENKRVLREIMLYGIGTRQKLNYWSPLGIHEANQVAEFLETYDIANQVGGVFMASDHMAIRAEMHQAGHFLDGWLLDNQYTAACIQTNVIQPGV